MKVKLAVMAACAALALATGTAKAGDVIWWVSSGNGARIAVSLGGGCAPRPVVTYVPVIVAAPACAWGLGSRTVLVPSFTPQACVRPAPPVAAFGGCGLRPMPRYVPVYGHWNGSREGHQRHW